MTSTTSVSMRPESLALLVNLTGDNLDVVFDDGGGITVQARGFVHSYDDPKQAANDVKTILATDYDPSQWDGDQATCYQGISLTRKSSRNGDITGWIAALSRKLFSWASPKSATDTRCAISSRRWVW